MRLHATLAIALLLAGCGYDPPAQTNTAAASYPTDLDACQDGAATAVKARNAKTGLAWFTSPVRRWGQIGDEVQSCMAGKGYGRLRWCTDDELRSGSKAGNVVATSSGIRCSEPPSPERRRAS